MTSIFRTAFAAAIIATAALSLPAYAQPYPSKPIRMLIPSPPGDVFHGRSRQLDVTLPRLDASIVVDGVLNEPGELLNLGFADRDGSAQAVIDNRDISVGIKLRLHKKSIGDNRRKALRLAIKAGEASGTPIMVHVGSTAIGRA